MKKIATRFLQAVTVLIGIAALAFLLWEPTAEGVNAHATLFEIYTDPFVIVAYIGSVPFFVGLFQAFKVLGHAGDGTIFSPAAVKALRTMRRCAMIVIAFVAVGVSFILTGQSEDKPPGLFMGMLVTLASLVTIAAAATLERVLRQGMGARPGKELTP